MGALKHAQSLHKGYAMKIYQVELKRTSYVTLTVEAESVEAAENAAWLELQTGDFDDSSANWELSGVFND